MGAAVKVRFDSKMPPKYRMFCLEYLVDCDGKRAAIAAGFASKSAGSVAARLLKDPRVARFLEANEREARKKNELLREDIIEQLAYCVLRTAADFADDEGKVITDIHLLNKRAQAAIDGIEQEVTIDSDGNQVIKTKLKLVPKATAIEMAMRHRGLFAPDKQQIVQTVNWDELAGGAEENEGHVEKLIKAMEEQAPKRLENHSENGNGSSNGKNGNGHSKKK